ncbi:MAG TPA: protein kinase, partial [Pyrinomonadaceae bacterium]|nr:protein kinase [Pyrinomonadaceae bacterium]
MTLILGTRLGRYEIRSKIGEGGMGEVYLARDTTLDRNVALKILPKELAANHDRMRRFVQEAKAASALNHPNIITIHEIGEADAGSFIVMEHVAGRTLRAVMNQDLGLEMLAPVGAQIAKALSVAHASGITHRDIKPENVMVRDDGIIKLLDFGVARLLSHNTNSGEAETLAYTTAGALVGTARYMSPEQARGERITPASDIFSLGLVFFEMATGRHAFLSDSMIGILHSIISQPAEPASLFNPQIPPALDALILSMLEKDAISRPTAAEVDQALCELGDVRGSVALERLAKPAVERHTVGRDRERKELWTAFESARVGRSLLLCVAGEPGIGKTTVVEDFLAELVADGNAGVARGRCSERLAGTEAYLPLLEALESLLQSGSNPSAGPLMKQIAPTWYAQLVPLSASDEESARLLNEVKAASQERMKRELGSFLQEVTQIKPLVLFFDDLHWADVSTIDVLNFLTSKFDTTRMLILTAYRPSDMLLSKHPFLQIKPDLQARGVCRELLLEFLNRREIADYLVLEFPDHHFPDEFSELIHAKTEGSPLFMADLVRYLRDREVIAKSNSTWTLAQELPDIERDLPESVRGMIERKIAQLSEEDRKLLVAASVQGYEFDSVVVACVLKVEADDVEERLEALERVQTFVKLVDEHEFPDRTLTLRFRFVHVLYQNALYSSLRSTRKVALSREVAEALETFYGEKRAEAASELASLWETAREYARAAEYFTLAAQQANHVMAAQEAAVLARQGLKMIEMVPQSRERQQQELS